MYCTKCGAKLPPDVAFCVDCGARVKNGAGSAGSCLRCAAQDTGEKRVNGASAVGGDRQAQADDSFFREYTGKYAKLSVVLMITLSVHIPAILLIGGQVEPENGGLAAFIAVPVVIWVCVLFLLLEKYGGSGRSRDGAAENSIGDRETRRKRESSANMRTVSGMEYAVTIHRKDGSKKRIVSQDNAGDCNCFGVGGRVRSHDRKDPGYSEKTDKPRDDGQFCAVCGACNDARNHYCERCGAPIRKGKAL